MAGISAPVSLGRSFVGIYTTTIAILGDRYKGNAYTLSSIAWGLGALAGPLIGGVAMELM